MQIVIEIDDDSYESIKKDYMTFNEALVGLKAIANGTPLPKGHGELIDRNKIEYIKAIHDAKYGYITWSDATARIKYSAPTIIEADEGGVIANDE